MIYGIIIGAAIMGLGVSGGYWLSMHSYRKGAVLVDNIYHDKAPFDEELVNDLLPSHVDGEDMDN